MKPPEGYTVKRLQMHLTFLFILLMCAIKNLATNRSLPPPLCDNVSERKRQNKDRIKKYIK